MPNILDRIARGRSAARPFFAPFRPSTVLEFFALRLAQKLGDSKAVAHYANLTLEHQEETLLLAYRKAVKQCREADRRAHSFHVELKRLGERGPASPTPRLAAIKVERRAIAVAVFVGNHLDYSQVRQLSSHPVKAEQSAVGFINWILSNFEIESATLEQVAGDYEIRRAELNRVVMAALRDNAIPFWEILKQDLLTAYGYPALKTRPQLRRTVNSIIWQMRDDGHGDNQILDAAALGLHVQTERLFITN